MNLLLALFLFCPPLPARTVPHATGIAHTEQVDLGYETFGTKGTRSPSSPSTAVFRGGNVVDFVAVESSGSNRFQHPKIL